MAGCPDDKWRKRVGVELEALAPGMSVAGARRRNPERSEGTPALAEASGSRTHRRQANLPPAGFEDRESHRTPCASVLPTNGTMLAALLISCLGLVGVPVLREATFL